MVINMIQKNELIELAESVNDYWIGISDGCGDSSWQRSTYMLGNISSYELTGERRYIDYAINWANANRWRFYCDEDYNTTNADYKLCGECYLKLMQLFPEIGTDEHIIKSMEFTLGDKKCDYWWWIDTMYMVLPLYQIMGNKYKDERYFEKCYKLFMNSKVERKCYDQEEHLWFRDEEHQPESKLEPNGKKIFWGRGNGWVFAGLARALAEIDESNKYYYEYRQVFCDMANRLKTLMHNDGFYTVSFFDTETYPYSDSSATVLIVLGFLIGVRLGVLDKEYLDVALRGFEWLRNVAVQPCGRIGWAQGVAGWPAHNVKFENSKGYVVGAFLLVLNELNKIFCEKEW